MLHDTILRLQNLIYSLIEYVNKMPIKMNLGLKKSNTLRVPYRLPFIEPHISYHVTNIYNVYNASRMILHVHAFKYYLSFFSKTRGFRPLNRVVTLKQ